MPMNYAQYPPNWQTDIRPRILARAQQCCEWCGAAKPPAGPHKKSRLATCGSSEHVPPVHQLCLMGNLPISMERLRPPVPRGGARLDAGLTKVYHSLCMPRKKPPPAKPVLYRRLVSLDLHTRAHLAVLAQECSDQIGMTISPNAVIRGLIRASRQQPVAPLVAAVEAEVAAGVVWGSTSKTGRARRH